MDMDGNQRPYQDDSDSGVIGHDTISSSCTLGSDFNVPDSDQHREWAWW